MRHRRNGLRKQVPAKEGPLELRRKREREGQGRRSLGLLGGRDLVVKTKTDREREGWEGRERERTL